MWVFSRPWNLLRLFICKHSARSPPFHFHSRVWAIQDRWSLPLRHYHCLGERGEVFCQRWKSFSLSAQPAPSALFCSARFFVLTFLLHSTRQSTSFSVWHWLSFISAEQNVQSVHSCNCVIHDKAHKKISTTNLFTCLDFKDNGLTTSTHTLSVLNYLIKYEDNWQINWR